MGSFFTPLFAYIMFIDATQIFGGRALTVTGMGKLVENVSLVKPCIYVGTSLKFPIVPSHIRFRCDSRWSGRCTGRSGREAGNEENAQRRSSVVCILLALVKYINMLQSMVRKFTFWIYVGVGRQK